MPKIPNIGERRSTKGIRRGATASKAQQGHGRATIKRFESHLKDRKPQ